MRKGQYDVVIVGLAILLGIAPAWGRAPRDAEPPLGTPRFDDERPGDRAAEREREPNPRDLAAGFWPSRPFIEKRLRRMSEFVGDRYGLDEGQYSRFEAMVLRRWPQFIDDNKGNIHDIFKEAVRARLTGRDPTPDQIGRIGDRVAPLLEALRMNVVEGTDEFRKVLRPEQQRKLEEDFAQAQRGLQLAEATVKDMQEGIFDPQSWRRRFEDGGFGPRGRRGRDAEGAAGRRGRDEREGSRYSLRSTERGPQLDDWERYVAGFLRRYGLDEGQETSALAILKDLMQRRAQHDVRVAPQIEQLERSRATATDPDARARIEKQIAELQAPLRPMADELHRRLELLLTDAQRSAGKPSGADDEARRDRSRQRNRGEGRRRRGDPDD